MTLEQALYVYRRPTDFAKPELIGQYIQATKFLADQYVAMVDAGLTIPAFDRWEMWKHTSHGRMLIAESCKANAQACFMAGANWTPPTL